MPEYQDKTYQPPLLKAQEVLSKMNNNQPKSDEQRVLAVEDEYVAAEINRDEAILRRILDDSFVLNSNSGKTSGKAELIEAVMGWNMTGQTVTERSILVDGDLAVIFGTTELHFAAEDREDTKSLLRYTSIYVKRQEGWRMIALHMTKRLP